MTQTARKTDAPAVLHSTFVIERTYPQSPAKVFKAFADKEMKRRWLIEGEGWEIFAYESDFRVGGGDSSRFSYKGGPELTNDTQYQDIVPNERLVFSYRMTMGGKPLSASLTTIELKPSGSGTLLVQTEQGAYFDAENGAEGREEGTRWLLDRLGEELARNG